MLKGLPEAPSRCRIARSISAFPRRDFLYENAPLSPTQASTKPCLIMGTIFSLRLSHVMEPMVPGMNKNRKEKWRGAAARAWARNVATAKPERLSLQREGWQAWQEMRISSFEAPGTRHSA